MTLDDQKLVKPVYGRPSGPRSYRARAARALCAVLAVLPLLGAAPAAQAQDDDNLITDAREAFRKKDVARLTALRVAAVAANHPLAMWTEYWDLNARIAQVQQPEVDAFSARWSGSYVDDRFRNDWLLELGKRRDWANFVVEYPRFRLDDDREVRCYALLTDHLAGKSVVDAARSAWFAQRDADDGCALLAATLTDAKLLTPADAWLKARLSIDASRPRAARLAAGLVTPAAAISIGDVVDSPARYLIRSASASGRSGAELTTLALMRMAGNDPDAAAGLLNDRWDRALPDDLAGWAWAEVGKQAALKLQPNAADAYLRAMVHAARLKSPLDWSDDMLAWHVRAALRADNGKPRWQQVIQAIDAMSAAEQRDAAWVYWKARALIALAPASQDAEAMRTLGRDQMAGIASGQMNFYASLAAENLGQPIFLPPRPLPLTPEERVAALRNPGFARSLQLIGMGLRSEGVREWNYSLRGMSDRQLLAAAQLACDKEVWDRCINTSDRTKVEIDIEQRFPTPFRRQVVARSREIGLDPAYVYGLIRQESRFIMDARSGVGASGLMQIMPGTALWTAKKIGLDYSHALIADRDVNLKLGTSYLKLVLDDFAGSQPMAAAAYNAGPGRPRRWREGPLLDPAAWAENIPFSETRDYVKKVLSNATYYSAIVNATGQTPSLKARLGPQIGPRVGPPPDIEKDMP
ncbi:MAG TPA: transglycosylase SLT domain-containing protein [Burkholderiaceae bacterium]